MTTTKPFAEMLVGDNFHPLSRHEVDKLFDRHTEAILRLKGVVKQAKAASMRVVDEADEGRAAPWDYAPFRSASNNASYLLSDAERIFDTLFFSKDASSARYMRIIEDMGHIVDDLEEAINDAEEARKELSRKK